MLLWGGWLLVTGAVFSLMTGIIHPYYTVALAPAIAALAYFPGATEAWRARRSWPGRATLAGMTDVSAAWAWVLLGRTPGWLPWLRPVVLITGIAATALLLAGPRLARPAGTARGRRMIAAASVVLALVASLAGPVTYSLETAATAHAGALPSAGPAVALRLAGPGGGFPGGGGPGRRTGGTRGGPAASARSTGAPGSVPVHGRGQGAARRAPGSPGRIRGQPASRLPGNSGLRRQRRNWRHGGRAAGAGGSGSAARGAAAGPGGGIGGGLGGATQVSQALTRLLKDATSYRWAAATVGAESAAPLPLARQRTADHGHRGFQRHRSGAQPR